MLKAKLFSFEKNSNLTDIGLLVLRLVFAFTMIYSHGWGKMLKLFGAEPIQFADTFGIGPAATLALVVFAEVICSFLIGLGLATRAAAIPLIITMLVAVFIIHGDDPFKKQEFALLYLIPYVLLLLSGAGRYSVDAIINQEKV